MEQIDEDLKRNNLFFRQLMFLGVLITIGLVILNELSFVIGSFLGAITLYLLCKPWRHTLVNRYRWKPWLASLLLVVVITLVLAGFLFGVLGVVASEVLSIDFKPLLSGANAIVDKINKELPVDLISPTYLKDLTAYVTKAVGSVVNTTYSFVINILFTIILLYFMLASADKLERQVSRYNPFKGDIRDMVMGEVSGIIYSNAVGIPVIMLGQGLTAALLYWIFGVPHIAFWSFMTAIAGLIPVVGSAIVFVPLGVGLAAQGHIWAGVLLIVCGALVIANVDNVLRILLNRQMTDTHPLIVIFGVLLGIPLFGFWGIIFGPLLISLFLLLVKIYYREFRLMSPEDMAAEDAESRAKGKDESRRRRWRKSSRHTSKKA